MAKRPNPYTDDFIQQSKIHVGLKQLNNNEDGLRKVYGKIWQKDQKVTLVSYLFLPILPYICAYIQIAEKTLELLFRGAKKAQNGTQNCETIHVERKDGMKQLFIGKDGTLLHFGNMVIVLYFNIRGF